MDNALTVDVEDWYMTNGLDIDPAEWPKYEDRVAASTSVLLGLLDRYRARGTFFVLGCVAERHPELVKDIAARGHEIGSHGYWHRLVTRQTLDEFRQDVRLSKETLERIVSREVRFYRAPSWSIAPNRYEALRILAEEGFVCDSSLQPFRTPLSGVSGSPKAPFAPVLDGEALGLTEFPPTVAELAGASVPFSGGFYLRAMPYPFVRWALRQVNRTRPGMIYVHPWELDPEQPRVKTSMFVRTIQYYGLGGTSRKLERLLRDFRFRPLGEIVEELGSFPPHSLRSPSTVLP